MDEYYESSQSSNEAPCDGSNESYDSCQVLVDNTSTVLNAFKKLYDNKELSDICLQIGARKYYAHRLILSAYSRVFNAMFRRPDWAESTQRLVELHELPHCETVFPSFLEYLYTGRILLTHTNVLPILMLADKYMVKNLPRMCIEYMCKHKSHAAPHNQLFLWYKYSSTCNHKILFRSCEKYIKWNFEDVANSSDFINFDLECLCNLLKKSDIVVQNEMMLYKHVLKWLNLQKIKLVQSNLSSKEIEINYKMLIDNVMQYIRFPMMTLNELRYLVTTPLAKEFKTSFRLPLSMAIKYHWSESIELENYYNDNKMLFTPRLYISETWAIDLNIKNFSSMPQYHVSTFVFPSRCSAAERDSKKINEWVVDFYPKGVLFNKCYLIVWQGTLEVPEKVVSSVRLTLSCRNREIFEKDTRVKVSVIIYGIDGGIECVIDIKDKIYHFTECDRVVHIDDLIPFDKLNQPGTMNASNMYFVGPNRDELKLNIFIYPID